MDLWEASETPAAMLPFCVLHEWYEYTTNNWRPYVAALAEDIEQHEANAMGTTPDDLGPVRIAGPKERQTLLMLEGKLLVARLALQSTSADVCALARKCDQVARHSAHQYFVADLCQLAEAFRTCNEDLQRNVMRIEHLQTRLQNVANLVSSFLELNAGFALQSVAKESRIESEQMRRLNEEMRNLAQKSVQDSAKITVLTILTLTYLPLTVVSNFFSTSFVGTTPTSNHIFVTEDWWILPVLALPLTLLTLYIWWVWSKIKTENSYPAWWPRSWRHTIPNSPV